MIFDVKGRLLDMHGYYPHCKTKEPPISIVWGSGMDYAGFFGPPDAEPPWPLMIAANLSKEDAYLPVPSGIELISKIGETPCTKRPSLPHCWYEWNWK